MTVTRWLKVIGAGLLAGLVGTLLMTLLMVVGRTWLGISPPPEALPDRFAPTLDISTFFSLFGRFGGYAGLKKFGVRSGIQGLFAMGAIVGIVYAVIVESGRSRSTGRWRNGFSRRGLLFILGAAIVIWLGTLAIQWPVLGANFRGLPPTTARIVSALGLLVAYGGYAAGLVGTYRFIMERRSTGERPVPVGEPVGRRAVVAGVVGALLALPSFALIRRLYDQATFGYDGLTYSGPTIQKIAPNDKFYAVTKNVVDPNVTKAFWRLQIDGLVAKPKTYAFDDLSALPAKNQETTLMCISNQIGSGLFSNAVWHGVPLRDLLNASQPSDAAVEVKLYAADGYTDTFTFEKAMDPTTMVVYQMNGEALPQRHGYPVRVIVPGMFGEKNVKWVTRIEVIDHDGKGFYEQQGWGPNFAVPTRSDIFSPQWRRSGGKDSFAQPFPLNQPATIRGRAFAGDRGVSKIEFSADDGKTWQPVRIDYPGSRLTWVFWSFDWRPTKAGEYRLLSRATDGAGKPQSSDKHGIVPQGASGYHRVVARVGES
jgi:DMSO/TMAO reductase YedYZ molybdopterin-dependent catalytic subunit